MGLTLVVTKEEDTPDRCVYTFGTSSETMGRVRLHKSSGDIEILGLSDTGDGASAKFCLAQIVPQLHDFHANDTYPPSERWQV